MAEEKAFTIDIDGEGGVNISEEVVAIIAGLGACEVDGVSSLYGGLTADTVTKAGAGKLSKAIRVVVDPDDKLTIRLAVNIAFGYEIPVISAAVQDKVKTAIESMTGLSVTSVDIRIASVTN